jgi:hypothetical protein
MNLILLIMNLNEEDIDMCQRAFAEMDEVLLLIYGVGAIKG